MGQSDLDQLDSLEKKVDAIVSLVISLKEEKVSLERKINAQEEKIESIVHDIKTLEERKVLAKGRVNRLLEKISSFNR